MQRIQLNLAVLAKALPLCCLVVASSTQPAAATQLQGWQEQSLKYMRSKIGTSFECFDAGKGKQGTFCFKFARMGVGLESSSNLGCPDGDQDAECAFRNLKNQKRVTSTSRFADAPIGALIFYSIGNYGHAALKYSDTEVVGHGNELSFTTSCPRITKVANSDLTKKAPMLGFFAPSPTMAQPPPIGQPSQSAPSQGPISYSVCISNIDDSGTAEVNGRKVLEVQKKGTQCANIALNRGDNKISFKVKNKKGDYSYRFAYRENGAVKWEKACGDVNGRGCEKKMDKGGTLSKDLTIRL